AAPPRPAARAPRARRRPRSAAAAAARAARSLRHRAVPARPPPARHTRRAPRALSAPPARADRGSTSRPALPTPPPAAAQSAERRAPPSCESRQRLAQRLREAREIGTAVREGQEAGLVAGRWQVDAALEHRMKQRGKARALAFRQGESRARCPRLVQRQPEERAD